MGTSGLILHSDGGFVLQSMYYLGSAIRGYYPTYIGTGSLEYGFTTSGGGVNDPFAWLHFGRLLLPYC